MERSMFSGDCFVETHPFELGVDLIVYLRVSPETSFVRIHSRARKEESEIPLQLLRTIHEVHEDWLVRGIFSSPPAPVIVIDAENMAEQIYLDFAERLLFISTS
ncbi:thymidine kinase 2, mitochondrial-like [Diprion similis]|uniref:thymidine kinase 2, mitochondrial-like n=1 Tax=Diprion similis TaxID=362088 RepID=UPI001EF8E07D|nr:thymidine kinase 2, mitochondrial-like [Diprion similis]